MSKRPYTIRGAERFASRPEELRKKYAPLTPYTEADLTENPTLAEMTTTALDVLASRGLFWLLVEAGDVDWASHANNIDTTIGAVTPPSRPCLPGSRPTAVGTTPS